MICCFWHFLWGIQYEAYIAQAKKGCNVPSPETDISTARWDKSNLGKREREGLKKFFVILSFLHSICSSCLLSSPALYPAYWIIVTKLPGATFTATLLTSFVPQIHFSVLFFSVCYLMKSVSHNPTSFGPDRHPMDSMHFYPEIQLGTFMHLVILRLLYMLLESHTFTEFRKSFYLQKLKIQNNTVHMTLSSSAKFLENPKLPELAHRAFKCYTIIKIFYLLNKVMLLSGSEVWHDGTLEYPKDNIMEQELNLNWGPSAQCG